MRAMLFEENVLVLSPQLAVAVGLNEAIILQQMHYWLKKTKTIVDGKPWIYNTHDEWAIQFPFWQPESIRKIIARLRKNELIEIRKLAPSAWDKTNYYTIQYDTLEGLGVLFSPATGAAGDDGGTPGDSGAKPRKSDAARNAGSKRKNKPSDAARNAGSSRDDEPDRDGTKGPVDTAKNAASPTETTTETSSDTSSGQAPDGSSPALEGEVLPPEAPELPEQPEQKGGGPRHEIPADMPGPKDQGCKTFKAWANYAFAYRKRYAIWPAWNAQAGGNLGKLIDRIGADLAPKVAAFYVAVNDARLIRECHPLSLLLQGCDGYRTQYLTGRQINSTTARQAERKQANLSAGEEAARRILDGAGLAEEGRNVFLQ
ncbi:MAG TPA: hypothetical protein VIZ86_16550 [Pseudomonas sp.]